MKHHHLVTSAVAPLALGLILAGTASASAPPAVALPPAVEPLSVTSSPLRVDRVTLDHRRLAVAMTCSEDGTVVVRGVGRAAFDCEKGTAVARIPVRAKLAGRLRGGRVNVSVRARHQTDARTVRVGAAKARLAASTFLLNGPVFNYVGYDNYRGFLRYTSGWYAANTTTQVHKWQITTSEIASGSYEEWYYYSATQGWFMYRKRECGSGGSACWWTWVHPSFRG